MRPFKFRSLRPGFAEVRVGDEILGTVRKEADGWHGFGIDGTEVPRVRVTRNEAGSEVYALVSRSKLKGVRVELLDGRPHTIELPDTDCKVTVTETQGVFREGRGYARKVEVLVEHTSSGAKAGDYFEGFYTDAQVTAQAEKMVQAVARDLIIVVSAGGE